MNTVERAHRPPRQVLRPAESPASYAAAAVLLASALVALLWVSSYATKTPTLGGVPFFYWYSMLWVLLNALFQAVAYLLLVRRRTRSTR